MRDLEGILMIEWFVVHPWLTGVATFFLMWGDWLLTILQERERHLHYGDHYQSYPINTIEGSPLYQSSVKARRIAEPKHLIPALTLVSSHGRVQYTKLGHGAHAWGKPGH